MYIKCQTCDECAANVAPEMNVQQVYKSLYIYTPFTPVLISKDAETLDVK